MSTLLSSSAVRTSPSPAVLLIAWRRPLLTRQVVAALRNNRPGTIFVALDGPSLLSPGDAALIRRTEEMIRDEVDWPADVHWRRSPAGQGSRRAVAAAVDWFFSHVDEGIILEDDCVPHPDFLPYCAELLDRYRDDERIMSIAGDNSAGVTAPAAFSYAFVRWPKPWGWATWRRAWRHFDADLVAWQELQRNRRLNEVLPRSDERRLWTAILDGALRGRPDSWDYRWVAAHLINRGLAVMPAVNLVRNIGFGPASHHTLDRNDPRADRPVHSILPLRHPDVVALDGAADRALLDATENAPHVRKHFIAGSDKSRWRTRRVWG
jgi:hypothetical protein